MCLTAEDIITITAAGNSVSISPDGSMVISPVTLAKQPLTAAERAKACRDRKASRRVTENVTPSGDASRNVTKIVTNVTENPAPPSPPPLPPTPPNPAPTPMPVREPRPRVEEPEKEPELFGSGPEKPHKRISWNPTEGFTGILDEDRVMWADAFPACDIPRQLSSADLWLRANPTRTKRNVFRFLTNWLGRQQERGGDARAPASPRNSPALSTIAQKYGPVKPDKWKLPS